jgi:2'-5' RNA ligase
MPYELEKVKGLFYVKNQDTGERKSKTPMPKQRALAYMRALYAAESRKETHSGIMVAFFVPAEAAAKLALTDLPDAQEIIPAGDLHITLTYLGDSTQVDFDKLDLIARLSVFARKQSAIIGKVNGLGRFAGSDDTGDAFFASFDAPGLPAFRQALVEALDGFPMANHGFMPHITLAYLPSGAPAPDIPVLEMDVTFAQIYLAWGDEQYAFNLDQGDDFTIMKQADGTYRWVLFSSNAFKDRDAEIVSTKALEGDVDLTDRLNEHGPLRWWHVGDYVFDDPGDYTTYKAGPGLDIGDCDFRMMRGRVLIESGTFRDQAIGAVLAPVAKELQASIRFSHPRDEPDAEGVFEHAKTFERSLLPKGRASNRFTQLLIQEVDEMATIKEKVDAFVALLKDPDLANSILEKADTVQKEADAAGVASKATLTKKIGDVEHPAGDFMVVEDPKQVATWHLCVKDNGKPDHALMGAAWAALTAPGGHRGKKYSGPNADEAKSALDALYKSEKMDLPGDTQEKEQADLPEGWLDEAFVDGDPVVDTSTTEPAATETKELSFDDIRQALYAALRIKFPSDPNSNKSGDWGVWDVFEDWFIYSNWATNELFRQLYVIDDTGVAVLEGDPIQVTKHTVYLPADRELMLAQLPQMEPVITGIKELKDLLTANVTQKDDTLTSVKEAADAQAKRIQALEADLTAAKEKLAELEGAQPRSIKQLQASRASQSESTIVTDKAKTDRKPGPDSDFLKFVTGAGQTT